MHAPPDPLTLRYVRELLLTGAGLADVLEDLLDGLGEPGPWPGERPEDVLLEMFAGSAQPAVRRAPAGSVEAALALMAAVRERVTTDLRLAAEIGERREAMGAG